jgi:integrase
MPRTPSVRYFDSRGAYYTQYRGQQHCLACGPKDEPDGPTYKAAVLKFSEIMHCSEADRASDNNLVRTVLEQYARHLKNQGRLSSLRMFHTAMKPAAGEFGDLKVKELKPYHVQTWLDKMGTERGKYRGRSLSWGCTMKRLAYVKLCRAFNWARKVGLVTRNPITPGAVEVPRPASRGRDYVLKPGEHEQIMGKAPTYFADLLAFLEATGCRPGEAYHATARHYDRSQGAIVYRHDAQAPDFVHKTARRTGKDRVILLTPEAVALVERLCTLHPDGPLLRNRDGRRWKDNAVGTALRRIRARLQLPGKMIAYSYRHSFATAFLLAGGSIKVLAELMGNSVTMIERHYGHLDADRATLRGILCAFKAKGQAAGLGGKNS